MAGEDVYQALALPDEALSNGGTEILRAGVIDNVLYVTARRAFSNHTTWGDVLADIARRLAQMYSLEDAELDEKEILTDIIEAFAADLGAKKVPTKRAAKSRVKRAAARKPAKSAISKSAGRKSVKSNTKRRKR